MRDTSPNILGKNIEFTVYTNFFAINLLSQLVKVAVFMIPRDFKDLSGKPPQA